MQTTQQTEQSFYVVGGTLPPEAHSYVQRKADTDLLDGLRSGEFCYVLNTRQVGKSSLMIRTALKLRSLGSRVAVLDITETGQNLTAEQFYYGLLLRVAEQLNMDDELIDFWRDNKEIGPFQRWMAAITCIALPHVDTSLIIFIDEIDAVISLPFPTDELFAGIRECYNRRVSNPDLLRLTFCLLGVAIPEDLIQDVRTTPFNIGKRIELLDFTNHEAIQLAEVIGMRPLMRVLHWTGGHPYLTQRLCAALATKGNCTNLTEVDAICNTMFLSHKARQADDNLAFVRNRILRSDADIAGLLDLYSRIRSSRGRFKNDENNILLSILRLAGLIKTSKDCIVERNHIYHRVFDNRWIRQSMPDAELRRQRAAYLRGLVRAAVISTGVLAVVVSLSMRNYNLLKEKESALVKAEKAQQQSGVEARAARIARDRARASEKLVLSESEARLRALAIAESEKQKALAAQRLTSLALSRERQALLEVRRVAELEKKQKIRAVSAESTAKRSRSAAMNQFYITDMFAANREYESNNVAQATSRLIRWRKPQPQFDFRGFEWGYLWKVCHTCLYDIKLKSGSVNQVLFSPDNSMIATAQTDGKVVLRNTITGAVVKTLIEHSQEVTSLGFNSDGSLLVTGALDHTVIVWDISSRNLLMKINVPKGAVNAVAISSDGKLIAADSGKDSSKYSVTVWDRHTARPICILNNHRAPVRTIAFSSDSRFIATGGPDKTVRVWELPSGKEHYLLESHTDSVSSVTFSKGGRYLATGGYDGKVLVWDIKDGKLIHELLGHTAEINQVAFADDTSLLASASSDRSVRIWDWKAGNTRQIVRGHNRAVNSVSISSKGTMVVTASSDRTIKTWNTEDGVDGSRIIPVQYTAESVSFSPGGTLVAIGTYGEIVIIDARTGKVITIISTVRNGEVRSLIRTISFSKNGNILLTTGGTKSACLWSVETGKQILNLIGHKSEVVCASFSLDGSMIATGSVDKRIRLWNSRTGKPIAVFSGHTGTVNDVQFSSDAKMLSSASEDGNAKVWSLVDSKCIQSFIHPTGARISKVAFAPSGNLLVTGGRDGSMCIWDSHTGKLHSVVDAHPESISSISFSSDSSRLLTSSRGRENVVRLWDWATRSELLTLRGHLGSVNDAKFSPDGMRIVSVGSDNCARIWSTAPLLHRLEEPLVTRSTIESDIKHTSLPKNTVGELHTSSARGKYN